MEDKDERLAKIRNVGPYIGLGTQLAITVLLMFFIGYWLDGKFNTLPLFVLVFSLFGSFAALYNFIRSVLQLNERKKKNIND